MTILVQLALTALVAGTAPGQDIVFLRDGGQLRGVVVEELPGVGVTIQLPGGELRKLNAGDVQRVEYGDAPVPGDLAAPPAEPTAPAQAPGWRRVTPEPSTFMLAAGLGIAVPAGDAAAGLAMSDLTRPQLLVAFDLGYRFTPAWMASVIAEGGIATAGPGTLDRCHAAGYSCDAFTGSLGAQLRYTFTPLAPTTGWIAVGGAWEYTEVGPSSSSNDARVVSYSGWQYLRLAAGWDLRNLHLYRSAFGIYGLVALGRYDTAEDATGTHHPSPASTHAWFQAGLRFVLGP